MQRREIGMSEILTGRTYGCNDPTAVYSITIVPFTRTLFTPPSGMIVKRICE